MDLSKTKVSEMDLTNMKVEEINALIDALSDEKSNRRAGILEAKKQELLALGLTDKEIGLYFRPQVPRKAKPNGVAAPV